MPSVCSESNQLNCTSAVNNKPKTTQIMIYRYSVTVMHNPNFKKKKKAMASCFVEEIKF